MKNTKYYIYIRFSLFSENNTVFSYFVKMTKNLITRVTTDICREMQQFTQIISFSLNYILTVVQWKILPHPLKRKTPHFDRSLILKFY